MGENIFAKFNDMIDVEGLKKDVETAASNTGEFVEVPHGDYEVKVSKIELTESKKGLPMAKVWFDILAGEFKGQKIFCNQMLHTGFGIHKMNELLNSFETGITVQFENFEQYADLFNQIFNEVDGKAEFQLSYTANTKNPNFSEYMIVQKFTN
jgi:hypothetical protein